MKLLILIFSLNTLTSVFAFSQTEPEGWEFLKWNISRADAKKEAEKNSEIKRGSMLDASFDYMGMSCWMEFNDKDNLVKVKQRKTFSLIQKKEAEEFYKQKMEYMCKKYGEPAEKKNNRKDDVITAKWLFAHTVISFEYDYKYKVIDEFGAGSYWVEIISEYQ